MSIRNTSSFFLFVDCISFIAMKTVLIVSSHHINFLHPDLLEYNSTQATCDGLQASSDVISAKVDGTQTVSKE